MSSLEQLSAFISDTPFSAVPQAVVDKARRHLLDTLGAALAGADSELTQRCLRVLQLSEAPGTCPAWGGSALLSARSAALVNGIAAHALELDDSGGCDHSGAVVVPALLAAVALCATPPSGADLIVAMVMGYEAGRRVLEACGGYSPHNEAGWHSTGTCGVFGAAAGCARLLGLNAEQTGHALGLAASMSGGLWAFIHDGADSKKLHAGRPAEGGLLAALLAREGMLGPKTIFADQWGGFLRTYAGAAARPEALLAELGSVWKLSRCSIKPHAACRGTHSAIDAVGELLRTLDIDGQQVQQIRVRASAFLVDMCAGTDTRSLSAAQMSLPYALAVRCLLGNAALASYADSVRQREDVQALMGAVQVDVDPAQAALDEPFVQVLTHDGRTATCRIERPLGGPLNPLEDAALIEKFRSLALRALPAEQVDSLVDLCLRLGADTPVQRLLESLRRAG